METRSPLASCARRSRDTAPQGGGGGASVPSWSHRWAGTWVLAYRKTPWTLAQRGPVSVSVSPRRQSLSLCADLLTGRSPGDTLLDGGRQGLGELGSVVAQGVIACRHGGGEARL